jgi:hypothetical protein
MALLLAGPACLGVGLPDGGGIDASGRLDHAPGQRPRLERSAGEDGRGLQGGTAGDQLVVVGDAHRPADQVRSLRGGVVGGCPARPKDTSAPVSASRTSTLQADVDESTPATSGTVLRR